MIVIAADLYHVRLCTICRPKPVTGGFGGYELRIMTGSP